MNLVRIIVSQTLRYFWYRDIFESCIMQIFSFILHLSTNQKIYVIKACRGKSKRRKFQNICSKASTIYYHLIDFWQH